MRPGRHYRRECFESGLGRLGYEVSDTFERAPRPGDVLISWNRNRTIDSVANLYEARGGRVLIIENGYLPGPEGEKHFALARHHHNGAGEWPIGDAPRFDIPLAKWRTDGEHILILPQRGIGAPGVAMPITWPRNIVERIAKMTSRPIRVRRHPGLMRRFTPLADDLAGAWACVTWASGAGVKALVAGVPVFHQLEKWIGASASQYLPGADIEEPYTGDRDAMIRAVSWSQWSGSEIASGEALARLLP